MTVDIETPTRRSTTAAALALLAVALSVLAQFLLTSVRPLEAPVIVVGLVIWLVAIGAFLRLAGGGQAGGQRGARRGIRAVVADRRVDRAALASAANAVRAAPRAAVAVVAGVGRSIAAAPLSAAVLTIALAIAAVVVTALFAREDGAASYWDVFGLWLVSIVLFCLPFLGASRLATWRRPRALLAAHREAVVDALALFGLSLVLRVVLVGAWPDVISGDEGLVGLVAAGMLRNVGNMFSTAFAYSNLYHLAVAATVKVLGPTAAALRLVGAVASAAAVPVTYLAARDLFGRRIGLAAGVLLVASHMHIHMSRTAHGHGVDALLAAAVILTIARAVGRRDFGWFALAGVALGAAQYAYVGARALDIVALLFVPALCLLDWTTFRRAVPGFAVALGASVVTAAPMIVWAIRRPGDYLTRINQVGVFQTGQVAVRAEGGETVWHTMGDQLLHGLLTPIAYPVASFYGARVPMLDLAWATLFVLGFALAIRRVRDWRYLLLVAATLGILAILVFSAQVSASAYRVTGLLPVCAILAAVALFTLAERGLAGLAPASTAVLAASTVVAAIAGYNAGYYFLDHLPHCRYLGDDSGTSAVSLASTWIADNAPDATVVAFTEAAYRIGNYPNAEYVTRRVTRDLGASDAPSADSDESRPLIYNVPVNVDAEQAVAAVGGRRPVVFWVASVEANAGLLDRLERLLPGGTRVPIARCGQDLAGLYVVR